MFVDQSSSSGLRRWPASRVAPWVLVGVLSGLVVGGGAVFLRTKHTTPPALSPPLHAPAVPIPSPDTGVVNPVPALVPHVQDAVTRAEWMQGQDALKRLRVDTQHLRTQLASLQERHRTLYANWRKTETWRRGFIRGSPKAVIPDESSDGEGDGSQHPENSGDKPAQPKPEQHQEPQ